MARMVTGSVADRVAPTEMASTHVIVSPSKGILVHSQRIRPREIAEMKVPANAKVRMVPMFRKKFAWIAMSAWKAWRLEMTDLMQFVARGQNNWRKEEIEEELVVKADSILDCSPWRQSDDETDNHAGEYGYDGFMYSLYPLLLKDITCEEGSNQKHDKNEESP
jgi:hypothetical protein